MWQLALKDIEQNRRAFAIFFIVAGALPGVFDMALKRTGGDAGGYLSFAIGYAVLSAPVLFAYCIVGQEKVKGTFRLLRILPVAGAQIILTKSITSICLCLTGVNLMLVVTPLLLRWCGFTVPLLSPLAVLWINLATMLIAAAAVTVFIAFDHKLAFQACYLTILGLSLSLAFVEQHFARAGVSLDEALARTYLPYWGGIPVVLLGAAFVRCAGRIFEWKEWPELEEI